VPNQQFGQPDKAMPSHGVARTATWKLSEEEVPAVEGHVKVKEWFALLVLPNCDTFSVQAWGNGVGFFLFCRTVVANRISTNIQG